MGYGLRIAKEFHGEVIGEDFVGYIFKISGGYDKQGFPKKQGVLTTNRVKLLLGKNQKCYRPRKKGERKRKSIRGCIVNSEIQVLSLIIVRVGEKEIEGLTD